MGQAFSIHTFSGLLGSAVAPARMLFHYNAFGWRGAFIVSAVLGLIMAGMLALQRDERAATPAKAAGEAGGPSWQFLLSPVILFNFAFFTLLSFTNNGLQNYSVVALGALHGTPLAAANAALSAYLLLAAAGVLVGGILVARTSAHGLVSALCMLAYGAMAVLLGLLDLGSLGILLAMSFAGLASGLTMPSRDMIVREVTPPGSFGKVFGFVTTGFNFAGVIAPLVYGPLMDRGYPSAVFLMVAAGCLLAIATVGTVRGRPRRS
jgi:MFS family permease